MMSADMKTRICDEIDALLEKLSIEDAAEIMTIQMASVIAQGSTSLEDAQDFLDDVRQDISSYLQNVDFEAVDDDDDSAADEHPEPSHS